MKITVTHGNDEQTFEASAELVVALEEHRHAMDASKLGGGVILPSYPDIQTMLIETLKEHLLQPALRRKGAAPDAAEKAFPQTSKRKL